MTKRPSGPRVPTEAERAQDRDFILARHGQLVALASKAFHTLGPGAVVVDQREARPAIVCLPLARLPEERVNLRRMVAEYDPQHELVVHLLKSEGRCSSYRLKRHLSREGAEEQDVIEQ